MWQLMSNIEKYNVCERHGPNIGICRTAVELAGLALTRITRSTRHAVVNQLYGTLS